MSAGRYFWPAILAYLAGVAALSAGAYDGAAGTSGSLAVAKDDPAFVAWATGFTNLVRGPAQINDLSKGYASFGSGEQSLGPAAGDCYDVVSLGDGGRITLTFDTPIADGPGWDFAVFENSFSDLFLELAFVEVSSDGVNFFRFDAFSETQTNTQVGGFGTLDPTNTHNLAGKYRQGFGTPFDLAELAERSPLLDVGAVTHVRIIDVVGTINPAFASFDSLGRLINDPWPGPFASGGFDLDAVGVRHVAGAAGFSGWLAARFDSEELADPAVAGPAADPDHDGRANLIEYALGTEPRDPADGGLNSPVLESVDGGRLQLSCLIAPGRDDLVVRVEWSADLLSTWSAAAEHVSPPALETTPTGVRHTFGGVKNFVEAPRQFLRLSITLQ